MYENYEITLQVQICLLFLVLKLSVETKEPLIGPALSVQENEKLAQAVRTRFFS